MSKDKSKDDGNNDNIKSGMSIDQLKDEVEPSPEVMYLRGQDIIAGLRASNDSNSGA